jgi:hypothetical protein
MSQLFPVDFCVTSGGLACNMSASVLGGTAPVIAVWLNSLFGNSLLFSSYIILCGVVTLVITLAQAKKWIAESAAHSGDAGAAGVSGSTAESIAASSAVLPDMWHSLRRNCRSCRRLRQLRYQRQGPDRVPDAGIATRPTASGQVPQDAFDGNWAGLADTAEAA